MSGLSKTIIALIILGIGIYVIQRIGEGYLANPSLPASVSQFGSLITSMHGITNTIIMGIGALVVVLIIVLIYKKANARRTTPKIAESVTK